MANKKTNNEINAMAGDINDLIDYMYSDIHKTDRMNDLSLSGIRNKAYESLKNNINSNQDATGNSAYSTIINSMNRLNSKTSKPSDLSDIHKKLFGNSPNSDEEIINSLLSTDDMKTIVDYDREIDIICEYMPILVEAINAKKDSILSADQFNKDFLMISNRSAYEGFTEKIDSIKGKYNLLELAESIFDDCSYYGEAFVYTAPYSEEIKRLMNKKRANTKTTKSNSSNGLSESVLEFYNEGTIVNETFTFDDNIKDGSKEINISINYSGILESAFDSTHSIAESAILNEKFDFSAINEDNGEVVSPTKAINSIPGAIIKKLDRSRVAPIYINEDYCFGYCYIESTKEDNLDLMNSYSAYFRTSGVVKTPETSNVGYGLGVGSVVKNAQNRESFIKKLSETLASRITPKFIVDNQDLKDSIYSILSSAYDDKSTGLKVTYIPPQYMDHFYWKKDSTGRGVSDLARSMVPAKLYIALYTGTTIGVLTRGFDKRVYYVKNNIDTNIAQNLMSTLNAIKASNKGIRDFSVMKSIINSSGRYNDLLIPTNSSGEAPIEFSILEGQNIDPKESLLEQLEHMAVAPTETPYEYLPSRNTVDYAVRLTMANGKFLKHCYKRQSIFEKKLSSWISKVYNFENKTNDTLDVKLPPPAYLSILNANQMIENVNAMVNSVSEMIITDGDEASREDLVKTFKKDFAKHHLTGYIDFDYAEELLRNARVKNASMSTEDEDSGDEGY